MYRENVETINNYLNEVTAALALVPVERISEVVHVLERAREDGRSIFLFGNGGSAATASHFTCDLAKGTLSPDKRRLKAFALTDNTPLISAWANDSAYEDIFAEQLKNYVEVGDVIISISGSGNSANIIKGVKVAKTKGATTIGFLGFDGGKLRALVDIPVVVPIYNMEQVEDIHLLLGHVITTCLRTNVLAVSTIAASYADAR